MVPERRADLDAQAYRNRGDCLDARTPTPRSDNSARVERGTDPTTFRAPLQSCGQLMAERWRAPQGDARQTEEQDPAAGAQDVAETDQ